MKFIIKLFQCFFCWKVKVGNVTELIDAKVIIAQSFGAGENNTPGLSNEKLAEVIKKILKYRNMLILACKRFSTFAQVPIVAQWEIGDCLPKEKYNVENVSKHHIKGEYLDTYEVLSRIIYLFRGWM